MEYSIELISKYCRLQLFDLGNIYCHFISNFRDIIQLSITKIIKYCNVVSLINQFFTQMRTHKTKSTSNQIFCHLNISKYRMIYSYFKSAVYLIYKLNII